MWGHVYSIAIIVLQETEAVENVHHESDGRKLAVDSCTTFRGCVSVEGDVYTRTDFQLGGGRREGGRGGGGVDSV